jgi:heme exporter protein A
LSAAIQVRSLAKSFGGRLVLRDLDLEVEHGDSLGIIGHNGSGKTTLIRILAGLSRPNTGTVRIDGVTQATGAYGARQSIGLVSHNTFLYQDLTPVENLRFYGRLFDVPDLDARIEGGLERLGLRLHRESPVRTLSRGLQQRCSIARALLHDPAVVLLDEPDSGLDIQGAGLLPELLRAAGLGQRTVVMTSHNLELSLAMVERVAILARGRLAWQRATAGLTLNELRDAYYAHLPPSHLGAMGHEREGRV